MTNAELIALAERLLWRRRRLIANNVIGEAESTARDLEDAAAALRQMAEQKPIGFVDPGRIFEYRTAADQMLVYASPVAQPSKEWLDEAMRLNWLIDKGWHPVTFSKQADGIDAVRAAVRESIDAALANKPPPCVRWPSRSR